MPGFRSRLGTSKVEDGYNLRMQLQTSTWLEVETYLASSTGLLIPIGATEQHGPNGSSPQIQFISRPPKRSMRRRSWLDRSLQPPNNFFQLETR